MVLCYCKNDENPSACKSNSTCQINGYCYSAQQIIFNEQNKPIEIKKSAGCIHHESGLLHCKTKKNDLKMICCKNKNLCNLSDYSSANTELPPITNKKTDDLNNSKMWTTTCLLTTSIVLIIIAISLTFVSIYQGQKMKRRKNRCECLESNLLERNILDDKLNNLIEQNDKFVTQIDKIVRNANGSKLFDQLELLNQLGNGEFATKYQAKRHGLDVFLKIYRGDKLKKFWLNEINIYKIILIRHENILNFVAKLEFYDQELKIMNYLTVTEYHRFGNLEQFLKTKPNLSEKQILRLMLSASSGVNHLHLEISNNQRKPPIVHRNINPKNFIVKHNLTCALANFNYAIKSTDLDSVSHCDKMISPKKDKKYIKNLQCFKSKIVCNPLVYCPPEYLDNSINLKSIVSLKSADVYSFGLVLWQISNYFYTAGIYRMPFCGQFDELVANRRDAFENKKDIKFVQNDERNDEQTDERNEDDENTQNNIQNVSKFKTKNDMQSKADEQFDEDLKRMKRLLLEQNKSSILDICMQEMLAAQSVEKESFNYLKSDESNKLTNQIDSNRLELFRIIKEACYIEPLSRLSIRKIENELNKLLSSLGD